MLYVKLDRMHVQLHKVTIYSSIPLCVVKPWAASNNKLADSHHLISN